MLINLTHRVNTSWILGRQQQSNFAGSIQLIGAAADSGAYRMWTEVLGLHKDSKLQTAAVLLCEAFLLDTISTAFTVVPKGLFGSKHNSVQLRDHQPEIHLARIHRSPHFSWRKRGRVIRVGFRGGRVIRVAAYSTGGNRRSVPECLLWWWICAN